MKLNNIIFDFDGTLVDTRSGLVKIFKKVAKELNSSQIDDRAIIELIGSPLVQILTVLLKTENKIILDRGINLFKKYYEEDGLNDNSIYPEIKGALELLKGQSLRLFIVSNKIELFINKILEQHDLKKYFIYSLGTDGTDLQSRKTDKVKRLLSDYQLKKEETAIIGDTENDIIAGKANSIYCIGVTWGYGSENSLKNAKADIIFHNFLEFKKFFKNT